MKYLFILGRNISLSVAEVLAYFGEDLKYDLVDNGMLVDLEDPIHEGVIDDFGGVIAIGQVICETNKLDETDIYFGEKNNFNYALWDFSKRTEEVRVILKKKFKAEKLKASEKKIYGITPSSKTINEQYFVFDNLFGVITQNCDYEALEKRDMDKPVRRHELAISPRLAKIMINLSKVEKEKGKLLDCFCGIGVILHEALLQKLKVVGIDKDKEAINGARENFNWFDFDVADYELINEDSIKINLDKIGKVDVIVSEPDLGDILRKMPTKQKAKDTLQKFETLMIKVLKHLKKNVSERIVFTSPFIMAVGGRIGCDINKISESVGLKLISKFEDFRKNQIVGREIVVLE